jgi:hypothetical protein
MKILVLSAYDDVYASCNLGPLSENKNRAYAEHCGYRFICDRIVNKDMHHFFYKFRSILTYIDNYDYVFWIDADAFFTNFSMRIEDLIKSPDKTFIATIDRNYLNTGVFIVKNCDEIKKLFKKVIVEGPKNSHHPFPDAMILLDHFNKPSSTWDIVKPQYLMNAYKNELYKAEDPESEFKENESLVLHFPGMNYSDRIEAYYKYNVENLK